MMAPADLDEAKRQLDRIIAMLNGARTMAKLIPVVTAVMLFATAIGSAFSFSYGSIAAGVVLFLLAIGFLALLAGIYQTSIKQERQHRAYYLSKTRQQAIQERQRAEYRPAAAAAD